jgi:hypothetical protein
MRHLIIIFVAVASTLPAANLKLYQKDGDFQVVREYNVEGDVVKFYSVERSEWEEMPAAMIDLKRTEKEAAGKKEVFDKQAQELADEEAAAKELRQEIRRIPTDAGVYQLEGDQLKIFKLADAVTHSDKLKNGLKTLIPVPIMSGKSTLEMNGEHSENVVAGDRPEFYLQLSLEDSFGIVKVTPQKGVRIVEHIELEPVTKTVTETREPVEIFTKQLTENGLYKLWPQEKLPAGEYAVIEYNEGKVDARVWDFRIR